jgi:hypothetical protein
MSEIPHNDPEHDARLATLYRAAAQKEPPAALDDAIRAAARRAVSSRPRLAGTPFRRSWRVPMSIAAVIVLCVSLVTLMREEAPEIAEPPPAAAPAAGRNLDTATGDNAPEVPKTLETDAQMSRGVGLKPPRRASPGATSKDQSAAGNEQYRLGSSTTATTMGNRGSSGDAMELEPGSAGKTATAPQAFPDAAGMRDNKVAAPAEGLRQSAKEEARRDIAATSEPQLRPAEAKRASPAAGVPMAAPSPAAGVASIDKAQLRAEAASADSAEREPGRERMQTAPIPAAKPVPQIAGALRPYAGLPPEKWLEQIETLRKQGRFEEAKTSLAEFRKRYPDYALPAFLKDGIKP